MEALSIIIQVEGGEEEAVVHDAAVYREEGLLFVAEVFRLVPGGLEVLGLEGGCGCGGGRVGGGVLAGHGLDLLEKVEVEFAEGCKRIHVCEKSGEIAAGDCRNSALTGFVKFLRL